MNLQNDPLTGLLTRKLGFAEIERLVENDESFGLILSDIDDFKRFNDTYSHSQGDELLCTLADVFRETVGKSETVMRLGGDEFVIFLPDFDKNSALEMAERIRSQIEDLTVEIDGEKISSPTVTLGAAIYPFHGEDLESILRNADEALIRGKNAGKNNVIILEKRFEFP
ncbi:MAG: GGDEF domain-containing protein [Pyrinomonadaceae bacterium]